MRKPQPTSVFGDVSDDLVIVHHLVEALDDAGLEFIKENDLQKYIDSDSFTVNIKQVEADGLGESVASLLGGAAAAMRVHWAIHDLMNEPDLRKIKNDRTREVALDHVPYAIEADDIPQEIKDKLNKVLRRK